MNQSMIDHDALNCAQVLYDNMVLVDRIHQSARYPTYECSSGVTRRLGGRRASANRASEDYLMYGFIEIILQELNIQTAT